MRLKLGYLSSTALLIALTALDGPVAFAQTVAPTEPSPPPAKIRGQRLEEIVVTARRRSEALQKVPVAVTALSSRDIKNQAIHNIADLPAQTPSLTISTNNSDPSSSTVSMRGQVQNDVIPSVEPSVGIYVDDIYFGQTVGTTLAHAFDLSRIEILKGPQGTLYGRNTTGGAIKLYTQDPTDGYHATLQLGLGDYDRRNGAIMVNLPIVPGKLDLRLDGQYNSHSGYGTNTTTGQDLADEDTKSFRGALKFTPTEDIDIILRGEYAESENGGGIYKPLYIAAGGAAAPSIAIQKYGFAALANGLGGAVGLGLPLYQSLIGGDPYTVAYDAPSSTHVTLSGVSLSMADRLGPFTLKSITAARFLTADDQLDLDGSDYGILATAQHNKQTQVTQEFQVSGDGLNDKLKYQAGVFYFYRTAEYVSDSVDLLGLAALGLVNNPSFADSEYDKKSPSVYGQAEYAITPAINVTAGLRFTQETDTLGNSSYVGGTTYTGATTCNVPPQFNVNRACHVNEDHADRNVSYTFGIDYTPVQDVLLYAKTSRGFKSGGINERVSVAPASLTTFLPETVEDYEGGIKSTFLDGQLRFNAAIYRSNYSNYQASVIESDAGNLFTVVQNAKSAHIDGSEFEVTAIPFTNFTVHGTAAWTDPAYDNFTINNGTTTIDESFRQFLQTPRWTFSMSGAYAIPTPIGTARLQLDYSYRGDADLQPNDAPGVNGPGTIGTPNSVRIQRSYGLLNAEASIHIDKWNADVLIYGKNITGKNYLQGELGVVTAGVGTAVGIPGEPATFGVDLTKSF